MITQIGTAIIAHQLPPLFLHPDPEQPFLSRGESGQAKGSVLETILMTHSSSHLTVPCRVTVPDLNVTLHAVCSRRRWPLAPPGSEVPSHSVSVVSSQYPMPLDGREVTWDNKQGWSIPRWVIDSSPMLISVYCLATLGGKEFQSAVYLIHVTGKPGRNEGSELNTSFES